MQRLLSMIHGVETVDLPQSQNNQNVPNARSAVIINVNQTNPPQPQSHTEVSIHHEPTRADHEIYFHQLLTKKRGIPLYIPRPGMQLPREYRKLGVSIGDVGIILHEFGAFDFLFNIFLPANHPINNNLVPPKFYPLDDRNLRRDIYRDETYGPNSYLTSSSVHNTSNSSNGLIFETCTREGAILTMPDGALTQNLLNRQSLNRYIEENLGHWYNYAIHTRGRLIENGDIRVVTGCDKVTRWGIATITSNIEQTLSLTFKGEDDGTSSQSYHWVCVGGGFGRVGPQEAEIQDMSEDVAGASLPQNQCVFVRTANAKLSAELWNNLVASQEVWSDADAFLGSSSSGYFSQEGSNERPSSGGSPDGSHSHSGGRGLPTQGHILFSTVKPEAFHPSTYLNNFLLNKYPKAKMVITQDADWVSALCDEDTIFPKFEDLCACIFALRDVQENNGTLTLQPKFNVRTGEASTTGKEPNDLSVPVAENRIPIEEPFRKLRQQLIETAYDDQGESSCEEDTRFGILPDIKKSDPGSGRPKLSPSPNDSSGKMAQGFTISGETLEDASSKYQPHDRINVIVFGQTGAGKSSLINMLAGSQVAEVRYFSYFGGTLSNQSYEIAIPSTIPSSNCSPSTYTFWDTPGLDEAELVISPQEAMANLVNLAKEISINLVVYCIRGPRLSHACRIFYDSFWEIIEGKAPIVLVVTGLEQEKDMDYWWTANAETLDYMGMEFSGCACVTTIRGRGDIFKEEYQQSRMKVWELMEKHHTRRPWTMSIEDRAVFETSRRIVQ